jgi:hypothetical protein
MVTTGADLSAYGITALLAAMSGTNGDQALRFITRPGMSADSPMLTLDVSASIFDTNLWSVSYGCQRGDEIGSPVSSSYFLRAARANGGRIVEMYATSSFFNEQSGSEGNAFRKLSFSPDPLVNDTGPLFFIGDGTVGGIDSDPYYIPLDVALSYQNFNGQMAFLRFWSKALSLDEWREHVRNPKSTGVEDPLVNYNFGKTRSGSFGRLRMEVFGPNLDVDDAGNVTFFDTSLNGFHLFDVNIYGFTDLASEDVHRVPVTIDHSTISPYFDEAATDEKVRIRGLQVLDSESPLADYAPVYEIPRSEEPTDDTRFTIEFSLVDALNRDIVNMFANLDSMDAALGNPELAFADDYPDLARMRDIYFNRLSGRLDFKAFLEFFRWFDGSVGTFIEQLVPRKTRFKGTNFVIESHMLERAKIAYRTSDLYLSENARTRIADSIIQADIGAAIGKF